MFYCKASNLMYFDVYDVKFDIISAIYALKHANSDIHNQTLKEYLKGFDL